MNSAKVNNIIFKIFYFVILPLICKKEYKKGDKNEYTWNILFGVKNSVMCRRLIHC